MTDYYWYRKLYPGKRITKEWLQDINACPTAVMTFDVEWPNGVKLTKKALRRAAYIGLDLSWLAHRCFNIPGSDLFMRERNRLMLDKTMQVYLLMDMSERQLKQKIANVEADALYWTINFLQGTD